MFCISSASGGISIEKSEQCTAIAHGTYMKAGEEKAKRGGKTFVFPLCVKTQFSVSLVVEIYSRYPKEYKNH